MTVVTGNDAYQLEEEDQPVPLRQAELNNLTLDLNLAKESAQILGLSLKEKHLLAPGTTFYWYRDCERELRHFFTFQDKSSFVYSNIRGLIKSMVLEYDATNGDFLLTHPAKGSNLFFCMMGKVTFLYPYGAFSTNERNSQPLGSFAVNYQ